MVLTLMISQSRWLSWTVFYAAFAINLSLDAWLLTILYKQSSRRQLPWFVGYVAWELLSTLVGITTWFVSQQLYVTVFWWMEGVRMALMVAAVRESLLRLFEGFRPLLRWSVLVVILAVIGYSAWKAISAPPIQSNRLVSFIVGAEFTFRWGIAAVAMLSIFLMWFIQEPMGSREDVVVTGCGLASFAFLAHVLSRSFFGTRFTFLTQYLPDVGYFVAVLWWIKVFSRPIEEYGFKELGLGPEEIVGHLSRYRELTNRIMRGKRS